MKKLTFIFSLLFINFIAYSQSRYPITVALQMSSPNSNKLADFSNITKITLRNSNNFQHSVFLKLKFTNNNGVFVITNSSSKPNQAINIPANGSFTLNSGDIQNIFSQNTLTFRGTSGDAILPEGDYSLCLTALDYQRPSEIRSDETCSNVKVPVKQNPVKVETATVGKASENIQIPNLLRPSNNDELKARDRQNVAFAWSMPSGANSRNYYFKIMEVPNNQRVSESDFWSKSSLYEKIGSANLLILNKSDAELQEGKRYAWAIQALGESNEFNRRNTNGRSEIRIFSYLKNEDSEKEKREAREKEDKERKEKEEKTAKENRKKEAEKEVIIAKKEPEKKNDNKTPTLPKTPPKPQKPLSEYKIEVGNLNPLTTNVKGKLLYSYPEDYLMDAVNNANEPFSKLSKSNFSFKKADGKGFFDSDRAWFTDSYLTSQKNAKPIPKTKVSLVMVYATKQTNNGSNPYYELGNGYRIISTLMNSDLLNYTVNGQKITETSKVLATTYTNNNGEFNFNFIHKDTCQAVGFEVKEKDKVWHGTDENGNYKEVITSGSTVALTLMIKTCILVIESPYYCSPVMFINPKPGDNISLPDQVSLVKSFELTLRPQSDAKIAELAKTAKNIEEIKLGAALENINIELFRLKPIAQSLPSGEGQNLPNNAIQSMKMGDYANIYPLEKVERVVAIGKSGADGKLVIPRIIKVGDTDNFVAHSYTSATTGVYNMYDGITAINAFGVSELGNVGFSGDFDKFLQFNTNFRYEKKDFDLIMKAKQPKILGKTVENAVALPNVNVFLLAKNSGGKSGWFEDYGKKIEEQIQAVQDALKGYPQINGYQILSIKTTDKDGYFEFENLQAVDYKLVFQKDGYKTKNMKGSDKTYEPDAVLSLNVGMLMQLNEVSMIPSGKIQVCVFDEDKNRVISDLQIDDSPMYVTEKSGYFKGCVFAMPAPAGKNRTLKIFPRSEEYFTEAYKIDIEEDGITNIKTPIIVYRQKHRMNIVVKGVQGNNSMPLPDAKVEIISKGIKEFTNGKGEALLTFESPGKNFLVKVTPPIGSNWTYFEKELANYPSKKPINFEVNLSPAREILAFVGDKEGKPLPNAQVYVKKIKNYWNNQNSNYAECTTDENGNCKLQGLPNDENNIEVFATKNNTDGITYIGDKKEAFWFNGIFQTKVDFKLQSQEGFVLKDIWGFPVHIEQISPLGNDVFEISGSLINLPETADFGALEKDLKLNFKKIKVIKSQIGENSHQPESNVIKTETVSIPIRICSKLQGKANGNSQNGGLLNEKLTLTKGTDGKGEISSPVVLEMASFEGAYQLKGKIELGETINNPKVVVFKASVKNQTQTEIGGKKVNLNINFPEKKKYFLGRNENNSLQNLSYKIHNFQAEAIASKSYLYSDSVRLYSILHTNIANMQPADIALEAGFITILPEKIQPFEGGNNISFSLEKWKVTGQKTGNNYAWTYDQNNGGIVIPKAIVNTGIISVGLTNMIIKPNKLIADKLELDNKDASSLTLGGFVPLEITKGSSFKFTFDPNCYHDYKPHWKLSLLAGAGQEIAASINNLDGLEENQKIEFGSMNLFSDNQQQLNGASQKSLVFRKILNFSLNTIDVQADNFMMLGQASMNIPNMSNNGGGIVGQIMYSKNVNGKAVFNFKPLNYNIEGKGQVAFKPFLSNSNQQLTSGKYVSTGKITVYDSQSGKSFYLDGKLTHEKAGNSFNTFIEILDNQHVPLGSKFLTVKSGIANSGMKVISNNWENLRLKSILPIGAGGFEMLSDDENKRFLTLIVKGAIETDPNNGMVGLKGMDTGVGSISLFYDFKREEMRGNFFFKPLVPINFGLVNLTSSNVSMAVGTNGFFIMTNGTGEIALPGGLPLPIDAGMNFVAGYYSTQLPPEDINTLISLSVKKSLPSFMQNGIKGMYSSVNLNAVAFDEGFDYGIEDVATVACWAKAGAAYEYRNYLNFNTLTNFEIGSGNYAYAGFDVGGKAEILSIGVSGSAHLDFQASVESKVIPQIGFNMASIKETLGSMTLLGCASVSASFAIEACAFGECIGGSVSKSISAIFGIENASPTFKFQFESCGNGLPAMVLNDSGY